MVESATGAGRRAKDLDGFQEEPPAPTVTAGTTGKKPAVGWDNAPISLANTGPTESHFAPFRHVGLDLTTPLSTSAAPVAFADLTGANRSFPDTKSLGGEIFRLKDALGAPGHSDAERAAIGRTLAARQTEWVTKAQKEGLREPTGPIDPLHASRPEVMNALLWLDAGGVVPRGELARDGGRAFTASVHDAVTFRTKGFEAVLWSHDGDPDAQRALLANELTSRGVPFDAKASPNDLQALYRSTVRNEESQRKTMGLDGRIGTADQMAHYECEETVSALSSGTTLGSLSASYYSLLSGDHDVGHLRTMSQVGDAIEGSVGSAALTVSPSAQADQAHEMEHAIAPYQPTTSSYSH